MAELHVGMPRKCLSRNVQRCLAGIDTVQQTHPWGEETGPPAGATAGIESLGVSRQVLPGEDLCVTVEHLTQLSLGQCLVGEARPLMTEPLHQPWVEIGWVVSTGGLSCKPRTKNVTKALKREITGCLGMKHSYILAHLNRLI